MEKITLSIFVPCFNEEHNITNALNNIKEGVQHISYEVLVADDASTDKTVEMVEKFKKNNLNVNIKIFRNKKNRGIGFNFRSTTHQALGKYYMMVTGDGNVPPEEIKKVVNNIGKADMILTYYMDKRGIFRRTLSKMFVLIVNLITFNNLRYYNAANIHLLENVKLYCGSGSSFGFQAELITEQLRQKKTYIEIEIKPSSFGGESQALKLHSILSVAKSIILIFFTQIIYVVKKILKIK